MTAPTMAPTPPQVPGVAPRSGRVGGGLLDPALLLRSLPDAVRKADPRTLWRNPVMFVVEVGSVFTTVLAIATPTVFAWSITVWLWLTVIFANLAEAVAEGRGKAQAQTLRRARQDTVARRLPLWTPSQATGEPAMPTEEEVPRPTCGRATSSSSRPAR